MIESYLCARDRFLKPGGKMFPNVGTICPASLLVSSPQQLSGGADSYCTKPGIAPFSDSLLHWEQQNKPRSCTAS